MHKGAGLGADIYLIIYRRRRIRFAIRWWSRLGENGISCCLFLHQTTTSVSIGLSSMRLYIVRFLHQTTTQDQDELLSSSLYIVRFLHQTTTSIRCMMLVNMLYIVRFLHQTTTDKDYIKATNGCISFVSYIKPQQLHRASRIINSCISFVSYIKPQL